jgi:2-(1,2-epoxy-1,2-dihydrophenyl)acetyl-CoA isomerase
MNDVLLRNESAGVLTLTLNRPEKLNALDDELTSALIEVLREVRERKVLRCIVLRGMGRAFSTGQDLFAYAERKKSGNPLSVRDHLRQGYNVLVTCLRSLEKPVIAVINGAVAGAGLSLALACDVRIASEDAFFVFGFSKIGLIPDAGASYLLPLIVGLGRAFELAYESERIDAREAWRIGLVNRAVPANELEDAVTSFTANLLQRPPHGLALTKRAFNRAALSAFTDWLEEEADIQDAAARSADHHEGIMAFIEKRPAKFTGC